MGSLFRPNGREYNISPSNHLFSRGSEERVAPSVVITTIFISIHTIVPGFYLSTSTETEYPSVSLNYIFCVGAWGIFTTLPSLPLFYSFK